MLYPQQSVSYEKNHVAMPIGLLSGIPTFDNNCIAIIENTKICLVGSQIDCRDLWYIAASCIISIRFLAEGG